MTLLEKVWGAHAVRTLPNGSTQLLIGTHLIHEVTSPQAFTGLRTRGLKVRRPDKTVATADHSIPTTPRNLPIADEMAATQVKQLETNCNEFGIPLHGWESPNPPPSPGGASLPLVSPPSPDARSNPSPSNAPSSASPPPPPPIGRELDPVSPIPIDTPAI